MAPAETSTAASSPVRGGAAETAGAAEAAAASRPPSPSSSVFWLEGRQGRRSCRGHRRRRRTEGRSQGRLCFPGPSSLSRRGLVPRRRFLAAKKAVERLEILA